MLSLFLVGLLAQAEADPSALIPLAGELLQAVLGGAWWAAALAVVALLRVAIRVVPWEPLRHPLVQVLGAFALAALGGVLNVVAAGASVTLEVAQTALTVAIAAGAAAGGIPALMSWWKGRGAGAALGVLLCFLALPASAVIGTIKTASVTCGTAATALRTSLSMEYARALVVRVPRTAAASIWVGGSDVTVNNGVEVEPGQTYASGERLGAGIAQYCIVASGTVPVRVQENY